MGSRLADKIVLITGSGSGIGRACALLFASEGAKVVVNDMVREAGEESTKMINSDGGEAYFAFGDISMATNARSVVNQAMATYGRIDVLFNNAGGMLGVRGSVTEISEEGWDLVMKGNLKTTFLMCKYTLPFMVKHGGGVVINMGSQFGLVGVPNTAPYCTAKAAIIHLTKQMALDYGRHNVRVNCLCPGPVLAGALEKLLRSSPDFEGTLTRRNRATLLGRLGLPADVARAALYLASEESSFTTGTALVLDGGYDPRLAI